MTALLDLAKVSDALVEAYSAGTMERRDLHYEALRHLRRDIIFVSATINLGGRGYFAPQ